MEKGKSEHFKAKNFDFFVSIRLKTCINAKIANFEKKILNFQFFSLQILPNHQKSQKSNNKKSSKKSYDHSPTLLPFPYIEMLQTMKPPRWL